MADILGKVMGIITSVIGLVIVASIIATQNAAAVGGAIPWLILGFVTVFMALGLLAQIRGLGQGK